MPDFSFNIAGTVYESIAKGRAERRIVIAGAGGMTGQDIYINGSTSTSKGLTLFVKNLTTGELYPQPVITSSTTGKYIFDCNNFVTAWAVGQEIQIIASNVVDTLHSPPDDDQKEHSLIGARRRILVDRDGNEYDTDNPMPVLIKDSRMDYVNGSNVFTTNAMGQVTQMDRTVEGKTYRKTLTYTSQGFPATESAWLEV